LKSTNEKTLRNDSLIVNKIFKPSSEKFETNHHSVIADDLPVLLCRFNKSGKIIFANKAYSKLFGLSKDEIIGTQFQFPIDDIDNKDSSKPFLNRYKKQFSLKLNEDKIHWIEWTINRIADKDGFEYQAIGQDITDFKLLEEHLSKILIAVEQSSSTVVITDINGNIEYVNPRFTEITGYTFEEVKGNNTRILKAGFTSDSVYEELWNTIRNGKEWQGELLNKKKNGDLFWELVTISPVKNKEGLITNYIAVKEDITEHKKNEKLQDAIYKISHAVISTNSLTELYESIHKTLSTVLPVDNFYIALYDEATNLLSFPYFVDLYDEPSPPQTPGRGLTEYVLRSGIPSLVTPDVFQRLVEEKEVDLVGTDSLDWLGVPLKINNKTIGVIVVQSYSENIRLTEREKDVLIYVSDQIALAIERTKTLDLLKSSEERYRLIFDKAADLIAIIDSSGKILDLNYIFEEETGYNRVDVIGKNIFNLDILLPKSKVTAAFYLSRIMMGKEVPIFEIEGTKKDGNIITYELRAVPIIENEKRIGVQAILRNITKRKQTEARLQKSEKQLSNLMSNLPGMAYRCKYDSSWSMEFVSQGCVELTGYSADDLVGNNTISYVELIHPEDRENVYNVIAKSVKQKSPFQLVYRIRTIEGKEKWVWEKGNAVISNKKKVEALEGFITDISNRVHAEEALKESEELYRKLIATLPDIIAITNVKGEILFLNEVGIRFSGYKTFEEVKHKNFIRFIAHEDREKVIRNFKVALKKNIGPQEYKFVNIHGEEFLFEIQREVLTNSDNSPYGLIFSCRDITFRKKAEQAIAQSEEKYRTLMDSIQDGVFSIEGGIITYANRALAEMIGYDIEETIGSSFTKFVAPEDMELVTTNYKRRQDGLNPPTSYEWRMLHKDGRRIYVNMSARIIQYHGRKATIGTLKDVTHQKELEQILLNQKNLFKGVADAANILLTERDFDLAINKTLQSLGQSSDIDRVYMFENSFDSETGEPLMNQRYEWTNGTVSAEIDNPGLQNLPYFPMFKDWYPELKNGRIVNELVKNLNPELRDLLSVQKIKSILLVPIMVKNKFWGFIGFDYCKSDRIWNESEISILQTTAANLGGVIEREIAKKELIEAKETAEEMSKLKSNFLANMSHELRTPLIAILGYTEILGAEIKQGEWNDMIDTIMNSGRRLLETLNLILDLSKIEADKVNIKASALNVSEEVIEIVNLLKPVANKKKLYLKTEIKNNHLISELDKRFFHSIITNLVNNGIKYTSIGGVTVSVDSFMDQEKLFSSIKVSDTGIGIAKENQELIFDEFRQVSEGYNRNFEGAGLGLTITKKFVEKMGGKITLESNPGEGSVFTVTFPAHINGNGKAAQPLEIEIFNNNYLSPKSESFKALIIDDDPATRKIIELFLKNEIETKTVCNIKDALHEAESSNYNLILMDISLGQGISGIELLKSFRQIEFYKNVPVIAVTAHAMVGDREKFLKEGFDDYLSKPFSKVDLLGKVHSWAGKKTSVSVTH
jgi:PAS domain S-box-containing protein